MNLNEVIKHKLPGTHEEWLQNRLAGIGGSDAGALLGLNKYKSPYTLWAEKTGLIKNNIDNEAMRIGRDLEDYVAKRFTEETGKKVRRSGYSFQSVKYPFMLANVDRMIVGENAGLECKTANAMTRVKYEDGNIPDSYYAQCMHYMAVTGCDKWYIAILVLGKGFYWYEVNRNDEEIKTLITAEKDFWRLIQENIEPTIDGSDSTEETLRALYCNPNEELDVDCDAMMSELEILANIDDQITSLNNQKKKYQNQIKHYMGNAAYGHAYGFKISYKESKPRSAVDSKKLKENYPDVYQECIKTSKPARPFKLERVEE